VPNNHNHHQQQHQCHSCCLNSRGNSNYSSRSSSQSQSMSPIINRARSSSVTGFYALNNNSNLNKQIFNGTERRKSLLASSSSQLIDEDLNSSVAPMSVINFDDNDQGKSPLLSNNAANELPPIYNIDWSDVNSLELDFVVYKTLPNIRKQLEPNEVRIIN
jgi:hypothetical protein